MPKVREEESIPLLMMKSQPSGIRQVGSRGFAGRLPDLLRERLEGMSKEERANYYFYNGGPQSMVRAAIEVQPEFAADEQIFSAVDYVARCGVGICGDCATPNGRRICVDGPFLSDLNS
jgi:hypothetical protein